MATLLELIGVLTLAFLALKTKVDIAYDKKKGLSFHVHKDASSDLLVRSFLSSLLSLASQIPGGPLETHETQSKPPPMLEGGEDCRTDGTQGKRKNE